MLKNQTKQFKYSLSQNFLYVIKNMWNFNRGIFIYALLQALAGAALPILGVYLPKLVLDGIVNQWSVESLFGVISIISLLIAFFNFLSARAGARFEVVQNLDRFHYMNEVEKVIMRCDYSNVENPEIQVKMEQAGDVVFTGNSKVGLNGMANGSRDMLVHILSVFTFSVILLRLNVFVLGILFITSYLSYKMTNQVALYEHKHRKDWAIIDKKIGYIHKNLVDTSKGKDIRVYHCLNWFQNILNEQVFKRAIWLKRVMIRQFGVRTFDIFMLLIRDGLGIGWIIYSVLLQRISIGDFMLYFGAISQFSGFVTKMMSGMSDLKRSSLDICILRDFLEIDKQNPKVKYRKFLDKSELPVSIAFDHVFFRYPNDTKDILTDIHFTIKKGEKMALVGSNGAGKTTLIKLLCGFYKPTKGKILINDVPLSEYSREDIYKLYSAVFQDIMLLPFSVAQNVAMEEEDKINKNRVKECLRLAGLAEKLPDIEAKMVKAAYDSGIELSGGESQKLLLARAIYKDAPILVLDEPSSALDPIAENKLYLQYNELTQGKTSLFISHRLASTYFCDRILFLEHGKIAEIGTHEELLKNHGSYAKMFEVQSSYYKEGGTGHE